MTHLILIYNSFTHYIKANLLVAIGISISTAVLTGALIIGDSVKFSLEKSTFYRLGNTTHIVSAKDRYFRTELATEFAARGRIDVAPVLILDGMAVADGGEYRVNKVQVTGIDNRFSKIADSPVYLELTGNDVIISENLAERLRLKKGDSFLTRIKKASLIPLNAPFVSDAETNVSFRVVVREIVNQHRMGFFNLKNTQTAPYNIFLSLSKMNDLLKFDNKSNHLLISQSSYNYQQINSLFDECFTMEDAGLRIREIPLTHEEEITSERVFIDDQLVKVFGQIAHSHSILTYFVNSLEFQAKSTPYSFISTIDDNNVKDNDIIINDWVSSDLKVKTGDSLTVRYFVIGPLRQLIERGEKFVIKEIVAIEGKYADKDLMPFLPGLSDAGHCREWESGVPIKLESIRDKDEAYWNKYKGTPKAFISLKKAHEIWSNRFGNNTAVRVNKKDFSEKDLRALFSVAIKPQNLGIMLTNARSEGLNAARNGTDFSQLFLGLSFFLLVASIVLTSLLTLLNLKGRQAEIGTLVILGFNQNLIRKLLLAEGIIVAMFGAIIGLVLAVVYTKLIFIALNSIWWDVVRTSVLEIVINPGTIIAGSLISVFISVLTILISVNRTFKRQAAELQMQRVKPENSIVVKTKKLLMLFSLVMAFGLVLFQLFVSQQQSESVFFLSGGLLLIGLLLSADHYFRQNHQQMAGNFSVINLSKRNLSVNLSRSLTVIILFALGTFLVVSTGANRQDLLYSANFKTGGTGGFKYFAETSVPVLYNLNDKNRRINEGLNSEFQAVQFSRMDGDDASCLNLNRVSNPAILGADSEMLRSRFSFATKSPEIQSENVWEELNVHYGDHVIPAIADQTVIQWGLGKNIGDTLFYRNELGDTLGLKLIAGLSPSVFQGYILISNANFLKNFPANSGSNIFLIDPIEGKEEKTGTELRNVFRDWGWEMTTTVQRLMEFNSVTNNYLSIFLALGALGLMLGTVGLSVVLARTLLERRKEIAVMYTMGFTQKQVTGLFVREYLLLLSCGISIGFVAAVVAVLPNFLSSGSDISFLTVFLIILAILFNGIFWIMLLTL